LADNRRALAIGDPAEPRRELYVRVPPSIGLAITAFWATARFMRRPKRINSRIVDQDIDVAVSKFDRSSRDLTGTRSIP
jgi:hypothetical protein